MLLTIQKTLMRASNILLFLIFMEWGWFDPVNLLNINNYRNQDGIITEMFELLADRICVIHAKDFAVEGGAFKTAKQTYGKLNYKLILEKMEEYSLDIPIICEEIDEETALAAFGNMELIQKV